MPDECFRKKTPRLCGMLGRQGIEGRCLQLQRNAPVREAEVVADGSEVFTLSELDPARILRFYLSVARVLSTALPWAEVEHVGSTAVPGCLTKGDLDVLVRVGASDFDRSTQTLDRLLVPSRRNERTDEYAEYDYSRRDVTASVQLVLAGRDLDDHFRRLRAILTSDPKALDEYNAFKERHDGGDMEAYRNEKERLIDSLLNADAVCRDCSDATGEC